LKLKRNFFCVLWAAVLFLCAAACDILRDSPFEVSAWSPGEGFFDPAENFSLSLKFSHDPDRASVERCFTMTENGNRMNGAFVWEGRRMFFQPKAPLEENRDYVITLAQDAMDETGLSMDKQFEGTFTTRPVSARPRLLSVSPADGGILREDRGELRLVFSESVPLASLRDHVSLSPGMDGVWSAGEEPGLFCFTPAEPWKTGQRHEVHVSASLAGENGLSLGRETVTVFFAGEDTVKPFLTGAWRLEAGGAAEALVEDFIPPSGSSPAVRENSGWGRDSRIGLAFSEPVDTASLKSCLIAEPAPSLVLETPPGLRDEVVFRFTERPSWGSRFSFQLKAGVRDAAGNESEDLHRFFISVDGPNSRPPSLIGIRLPMAPGKTEVEDQELRDYSPQDLFADLPIAPTPGAENGDETAKDDDRYPYGKAQFTWIELYFETAPGLTIDPFSVMELFRIETSNRVFTFSPRSIRAENFSSPDPRPGWESYVRLEIRGYLTNTINSGVVSFRIDPGLEDTGGNRSGAAFLISLLK
jgi:hypothetical protein